MSRSGYTDDCDTWALIRWRGAVQSALRGKRGQAFLREMITALDAMPEKRLIAHELKTPQGVCALGAVADVRAMPVEGIDYEDREQVAFAFGIAEAMAAEIAFMNDEYPYYGEREEERWQRMRDWAESELEE